MSSKMLARIPRPDEQASGDSVAVSVRPKRARKRQPILIGRVACWNPHVAGALALAMRQGQTDPRDLRERDADADDGGPMSEAKISEAARAMADMLEPRPLVGPAIRHQMVAATLQSLIDEAHEELRRLREKAKRPAMGPIPDYVCDRAVMVYEQGDEGSMRSDMRAALEAVRPDLCQHEVVPSPREYYLTRYGAAWEELDERAQGGTVNFWRNRLTEKPAHYAHHCALNRIAELEAQVAQYEELAKETTLRVPLILNQLARFRALAERAAAPKLGDARTVGLICAEICDALAEEAGR